VELFLRLNTFFVPIEEVLQMSRIISVAARMALVLSVALMLGVTGCGGSKTGGGGGGGGGGSKSSKSSGKKLNEADQARLDEARQNAENSERKLSELRLERIELERGGK
jgi:hypothetical protein